MFSFDSASPEKSCLAWSVLFRYAYKFFEFLNATRSEWNLPQERKISFSFPVRLWKENRRIKAEGTVKVWLLHLRRDLRKCVTLHSYLQVGVILLNAFTLAGVVEVRSWFHRNICFMRFSLSKVQADKTNSSFEREDVFQEELFFTLGKVLAMQSYWNITRHHISSLFNWFCKLFQPENVASKLQLPRRSWTHFLLLNELHGSTILP